MKESDSECWFIVSTKPKQEFVAERSLRSLGANTYLPLFHKKVKKKKEKTFVVTPLFAGYMFAQFNAKDLYHKVRYTRGVKAVLGNKEGLWTIDESRIDDIKNREDEQGMVKLVPRDMKFHSGDRILIDEGDFDGWEGVFFEELPDNERAIIMLTSVSYSSKLIVQKKFLRHK